MNVRETIYRRFFAPGKLDLSEQFYREALRFDPTAENRYLREILEYARAHVPYYRDLLPPDPMAKFGSIPTLSKETIRESFRALTSELPAHKRYLNSTGGSTGSPLVVYQDLEMKEWARASETYFYREFLGIDPYSEPTVVLWGSLSDITEQQKTRRKRIALWLTRTVFLNCFRMSPPEMRRYIDIINHTRPAAIKAYAGAIYQLAKFAREKNLRVHSPRVIYTSAETLSDWMRPVVEEVFNCKVQEAYLSREITAIAGQCKKGKMHILSFNTVTEVVDDENRPTQPGEEGRILCTTLHNHSMPLIRYEIQDVGVASAGCDCGIRLPCMERVRGRVIDNFMREDGTLIHGGFFIVQLFYKMWIDEFQILQKEPNLIEILYVPRLPEVQSDKDEVAEHFRAIMGPRCRVVWMRVDEVPRTPQGKQLHARSMVDPNIPTAQG